MTLFATIARIYSRFRTAAWVIGCLFSLMFGQWMNRQLQVTAGVKLQLGWVVTAVVLGLLYLRSTMEVKR